MALKVARSGAPVIWDAHEDYIAQFTESGSKDWVPGPARRVVRRGLQEMLSAIDRRASGVIAATPTIASLYSNARIAVVGNEARVDDFTSCTPDFSTRRVLFTGHIDSSHLFGEAVEAVKGIPDVKLAVAGREPNPEVWAPAKQILGDRLEYLGWLDRRGLAAAINSSALGLALYAPLPTYMAADASPTKVFEFAAAGLPILGSPIPSVTALLESGGAGFVVKGFTGVDLRASIGSVLDDEVAWRRASEGGRLWATTSRSWQQSESELMRLYGEILDR